MAAPITVEGNLWGAISAASTNPERPPPPGTEMRLVKFTELVATAIANAEGSPSSPPRAGGSSRPSDETRRRIERDLHDGTQQRLVSLGLAVRAAEASLPPERDDLRAQLSGVATGLAAAVEDLQEISRGIHPAILSKGGLGPALQALAHRSAIPVDLELTTDVRLAEPIEVAAYFVASEALANAAKHSQASRIDVSLEQRDGRLVLSIGDDGVGGADARPRLGSRRPRRPRRGSWRVDPRRQPVRRGDADHGRVAGRARVATAGRLAPCPKIAGSGDAGRRVDARSLRVPLRCVIVDDNLLFLEGAVDLLRREGLDVVGVASDSAEAIRLVTELRPDVTLVDIDLGDEDGFELARRLHAISALSKVILVSTHAEDGSRAPDRTEPGARFHRQDAALGAGDPRHARTRGLDLLLAALEKRDDREDAAVVVLRLRQSELGEDVPDVLLDRSLGEPELTGDAGVRAALGHERQHLAFARREDGERVVAASSLDQRLHETRVDDRSARRDPPAATR